MGEIKKNFGKPQETAKLLDGVLLTLMAHMRYLQEEHGSLYVGGQYGTQTKNIYRSMQKNTSNLTPEDIENLKTAVSITPMPQAFSQDNTQGGGFRGGWRG